MELKKGSCKKQYYPFNCHMHAHKVECSTVIKNACGGSELCGCIWYTKMECGKYRTKHINERLGMGVTAKGVDCGKVSWMRHSTPRYWTHD